MHARETDFMGRMGGEESSHIHVVSSCSPFNLYGCISKSYFLGSRWGKREKSMEDGGQGGPGFPSGPYLLAELDPARPLRYS